MMYHQSEDIKKAMNEIENSIKRTNQLENDESFNQPKKLQEHLIEQIHKLKLELKSTRLNEAQLIEELTNLKISGKTAREVDRSNPDTIVDSIIVGQRSKKIPTSHQTNGELVATTDNSKSYISWDEYFMSVAQLAARRSKDPCTQVGACIVNNQNKIVATGYNGMPNGIHDTKVPWTKEGSYLETKYAYVVHAELNAILNSTLTDLRGCRVYVSLFPCNECAKAIIQAGVKHVIYLSDKHADKDSTKAAKSMFGWAGVSYEPYSGLLNKLR